MRLIALAAACAAIVLVVTGCTTTEVFGTAAGTTAVLGQSPTHDLEETYYVGVFDPQGQVPPSLYRFRMRGQASWMSGMRFASGWVPALFADSLGTNIRMGDDGNLTFSKDAGESGGPLTKQLNVSRRMIMFGPEGFRESPADHRLVVVMGTNPEGYFEAMNTTTGAVIQQKRQASRSGLGTELDKAHIDALKELDDLRKLSSVGE